MKSREKSSVHARFILLEYPCMWLDYAEKRGKRKALLKLKTCFLSTKIAKGNVKIDDLILA